MKPLNVARSALGAVLDRQGREALAIANFRQVLEVVTRSRALAGVVVLSRDSWALAEARSYGVYTVTESGAPDRNAALMRATLATRTFGATATLMLAADLPLVVPGDLEALARLGALGARSSRLVVASPDRFEDGTNALLMRPPGIIPYALGPGSFKRHQALARAAGAAFQVWQSPGLSTDVDTTDDLSRYLALAEQLGQPVACPVCWSWRPARDGAARRVYRYAM
ncbi:MAG: hypothetical protein Kow00120_29250 [Anaerolineae bacterium]